MLRLATLLYTLIGTTLAGTGIVAVLTVGADTLQPILYAAVAGFLVALPVSWLIAKALYTPR